MDGDLWVILDTNREVLLTRGISRERALENSIALINEPNHGSMSGDDGDCWVLVPKDRIVAMRWQPTPKPDQMKAEPE